MWPHMHIARILYNIYNTDSVYILLHVMYIQIDMYLILHYILDLSARMHIYVY